MHILNISQSYYIIAQQKNVGYIGLSIFMIIIAIFIYFLIAAYSKAKRKSEIITVSISGIISFTILSCIIYPNLRKAFSLEKNYKETVGVTTRYIGEEWGEKEGQEYKYVFNGVTYTRTGNTVYNGNALEGIIHHDGHYVVIFDSLDPSNSEMDFKRKVENK